MRRLPLIAALTLLLASAAAGQGIFEYWKAGARTKRSSRTPLPSGSSPSTVQHAPAGSNGARPQGSPAFSEAWFADRAAVARQIVALREAVLAPMIGERYPLPRGGGFRCTPFDASPHAADDPEPWAMRCAGPDASCARENFFWCPDPGAVPVLAQVRWTARPAGSAKSSAWASYRRGLADSLSHALGAPAWADSLAAHWDLSGHAVTLRLHGPPARPDSIEVLARSNRLTRVPTGTTTTP